MIIISKHNHKNWFIHCEVLPLPSLLDTLCYAGFMEPSQVNVNLNLWQLKSSVFPKNTSKPKERSGWRPSTGLSQKLPCRFKLVDATSLKFQHVIQGIPRCTKKTRPHTRKSTFFLRNTWPRASWSSNIHPLHSGTTNGFRPWPPWGFLPHHPRSLLPTAIES